MRIGSAQIPDATPYQIGTDSLQVIASSSNPLKSLNREQVKTLFTGQVKNWKDVQGPDSSVEVWVYTSAEDIQQIFEQSMLGGMPITSLARLAVSPDEMAAAVARDANAVGLITKAWKAKGVKSLYTVSEEPILVYTAGQPQGAVLQLIDCLQK